MGSRTPGAHARPAVASRTGSQAGPAGGYTAGTLATAYGFTPDSTRVKGNLLAAVDAYHDPRISADLKALDAKYGLAAETYASFQVVGQDGSSALTLYGHYKSDPATYDVQAGGNGVCATLSPAARKKLYGGVSPNRAWDANVDCGFSPNDTVNIGQCYAQKGYDGPSGVGAPKGLGTFSAMAPSASISRPSSVAHGTRAAFTGTATDPLPGSTISAYSWTFGDGGTAAGSSAHNTYTKAGTYTVRLKVTDSYGVSGAVSQTVKVS